jgi:ethanolamine utilization cobalamin adenosyltransferase
MKKNILKEIMAKNMLRKQNSLKKTNGSLNLKQSSKILDSNMLIINNKDLLIKGDNKPIIRVRDHQQNPCTTIITTSISLTSITMEAVSTFIIVNQYFTNRPIK